MSTRSELGESPDLLDRLLGTAAERVQAVATAVRERQIDVIVIAARGTSDHAALYGQYVLGARNGLLVAPASPSLFSVYGTPPRVRNALVIGISQSGRSPDVVAVLDEARRQGSITVAITNNPDSELAAAADHVIELMAGPERAVAATKTYLAELAIIAMLSSALSGNDASAELRAIPEALRQALAEEDAIVDLAGRWAAEPACAVLARGFHYATAREWALKLKELAHLLADPYSGADFQHGPITLVGTGFPVLAVVTSGLVLDGMAELLGKLRERGARLLVASDDPSLLDLGDPIRLPSAPEWLSPLVAILPAQLFAYHLALARGLDTEAPRNLSKVTLTL